MSNELHRYIIVLSSLFLCFFSLTVKGPHLISIMTEVQNGDARLPYMV